jgi:hypothetical protein
VECEAYLRIKRKCDGKWIVHDFIKEHNHELFPAHAHYFPCHRRINKAQKSYIESLQHAGVRTTKIFATMAKQHGGYENIGCLEKDVRNNLDKTRPSIFRIRRCKCNVGLFYGYARRTHQ